MKLLKLIIFAIVVTILFPSAVFADDIITTEKLITVDTTKQKLFAWEGGKMIFETKVSTGMLLAPTVRGSYKIRRKVPVKDMKGEVKPYKKYFLKDVPNIMYFYQGYAIHGAYWHNLFGRKATHGCINLPVKESEWLYNWADIGTRVEIF